MRAVLTAVVLVIAARAASGAVLVVNPDGTGRYPNIQAAVDAATAGDTVLCKPGIYYGTGNRGIHLRGLDILVLGEGGSTATTIYPLNFDRAFNLYEGETAACEIRGFRLYRARTPGVNHGGGVYLNGAATTLRDIVFEECGAGSGGALAVFAAAPLLQDIRIIGCESTEDGGALHLDQAEPTLRGTFTIEQSTATRNGGAIYAKESTLTLVNPSISASAAGQRGGVCYAWLSEIAIADGALLGASAGTSGSVVYALSSTLDLQRLTIAGSSSAQATLEFGDQTTATLEQCLVAANAGSGLKRASNAVVALSCCDVFGNSGGNFVNFPVNPIGADGNISLDPIFCAAASGDYHVETASPCLPAHNACGVLIGGFCAGCTLPRYAIAGRVVDQQGTPLAGIAIAGAGDTPLLTDAGGNYATEFLPGWSGTLTPSAVGYAFTPPSRSYSNVQADQLAQDFLGLHDRLHDVPAEWPTLQAALNDCFAGDTVRVAAGTYAGTGNRNLVLPAFDVVVLGTSGSAVTTLDCGNYYRAFTVNQGQTPATLIQGFTILNGMPYSASGGGINSVGASPTLRDLRFVHCRSSLGGAIYMQSANGAQLENIVIEDGYAGGGGAGIVLRQSTVAIRELQVLGNRSGAHACGLDCEDSQLSLDGATFVDNECTGEGAVIALAGGSATLSRCLIAYNDGDGGIAGSEGAQLAIACSDLWQNLGGNYTGEFSDFTGQDGNLAVDPLFCDLGAGDWRLNAGSPCLPAGNSCGVLIGALGEGDAGVLHRVAGTVRDTAGLGLAEVRIEGLAVTIASQNDGSYGTWLPAGWSGTLTPGADHLRFTPAARSYEGLSGDLTDEDYLATNPTRLQYPSDFADLQEAVDFCDDGDTLVVLAGTYDLPPDQYGYPGLHLDSKAICLQSLSGAEVTVLQNGVIGLWIGASAGTTVRGFTIRGCEVGISVGSGAAPHLEDLIVEDNGDFFEGSYSWEGAGLQCWGGSPLLSNVVFRNNEAETVYSVTQGGAVFCTGGAPQFMACRFENNRAGLGGGVCLVNSSASFIATQFIDNCAAPYDAYDAYDARGGAIYCNGGAPSFLFCSFIGNEARVLNDAGNVYGGAVYLAGSAAPSFLNCSFSGNGAIAPGHEALGGGFYLEATAAPVLTNCIVAFGSGGGGFYSPNDTLALAMSCSNVFGNAGGDFIGLLDPTGSQGNIALDPHFCDREAGDLQLAANSPGLPANNSCGVLMGPFGQGCAATALPDPAVPRVLSLAQNSPNPFNPSTAIRFGLPRPATVDLSVYDALGRRVSTLIAGELLPAGAHERLWLGKDAEGRALASGVYFLQLEAEGRRLTRKMLLLK